MIFSHKFSPTEVAGQRLTEVGGAMDAHLGNIVTFWLIDARI